jgi:hypothetical protein
VLTRVGTTKAKVMLGDSERTVYVRDLEVEISEDGKAADSALDAQPASEEIPADVPMPVAA